MKPIKQAPSASNTAKASQTKMLGIMLGGLLVLLALIAFAMTYSQKQIEVVRLKRSVMTGDVITEDMLEKYPMLDKTYEELGTQQYVDDEGNNVSGNVYILWKDREELCINKTVSNYVKDGSVLTIRDVTDKQVSRNPWLEGIKDDQEIYTMKFDASDVNARLLMPGTQIRARFVFGVEGQYLGEVRKDIIDKALEADNSGIGVRESVLMGYGKAQASTPQVDENGNPISVSSSQAVSGEFAVSEVVIPRITIADMRNKDGESIFEIYSSLVKMPLAQRLDYLSTSIADPDTAMEFQDRITPVDLTFIVDEKGASMLSEFENTEGAKLKYTILPGMGKDTPEAAIQLMQQFGEISNQISSAGSNAVATPATK